MSSSSKVVASAAAEKLLEMRAEHEAQSKRLDELETIMGASVKEAAKAAKRAEAKAAKAAAKEAGEPSGPRGEWVAWSYGEDAPADGGDAVEAAKDRFRHEWEAYTATLSSKRGAPMNFASLASVAQLGDPVVHPVGTPKPSLAKDEEAGAFEARLAAWRDNMAAKWTVDGATLYAEHKARYKAISAAKSADGTSSKKSRTKLTEEEKLANREARKAATVAKNEAKKAALKAEKEAAKAAKAKTTAAAKATKEKAKPKVRNAAEDKAAPAPKPTLRKKPGLAAASDTESSDSESDEEEEEPKAKGKAKAKAPSPPASPPASPAAAEDAPVKLTLHKMKVDGKSVTYLKTEDDFLFKTTKTPGEPGEFVGHLEKNGSIDEDADNPFE
jgi:hypothetical protein